MNETTMKAVGYAKSKPVDDPDVLLDITLNKPKASGRDLLVKIKAIAINPVDTKARKRSEPKEGEFNILGWDAAGVVEAVGEDTKLFKPGDEVFYAGSIQRPGANSEYHLVDERIVGRKPKNISFEEAAALPLTSITAWEMLFTRFGITQSQMGTLLIIGAAGGVGSIMIQLAKKLTGLTIIATASRKETSDWVKELGADHVINHHNKLSEELKSIGFAQVDYIASLNNTENNSGQFPEIIAPQGKIGLIDDPESFDIKPFKMKSVSIHWEFMFTRSMFTTQDIIEQHNLLSKVSAMVDEGRIKTTLAENFGKIEASNLIRGHKLLESGKAKGKIVLSGF